MPATPHRPGQAPRSTRRSGAPGRRTAARCRHCCSCAGHWCWDGALPAENSLDFLSGLLIGEELRSALLTARAPPVLVGDPGACARYLRAFALFGIPGVSVLPDTASAGLWQVAHHAGLVPSPLDPASREHG